jgi:hypothetical protein
MDEEFVIQNEPPWIVEIEGEKFATPELVCLLLQDVSEERDQLKAEKKTLRKGIIRALQIPIGAVLDQHTRFALTDALKEVDDG